LTDIIEDVDDDRAKMLLGRREAFFGGDIKRLCIRDYLPKMQNLKELSLYSNKLESVAGIGMFANCPLESLNLGCNNLTSIPDEIGTISTLKVFWAEDNQIPAIPLALFELQQLQVLRLSGNQIPEIPADIWKLQALQSLAVDNNLLTEIPGSIGQVSKLQTFLLRGNQLGSLPSTMGGLAALEVLNVSSNVLSEVPAFVGELKGLRCLYANGNRIERVADELLGLEALESINLSNNLIATLPDGMRDKWQERLMLEGNPILQPVVDVEEGGDENVDGANVVDMEEETTVSEKRQRVE
jgi:Leucine-rich repeat (LRR) protein